jgi:small acid-soluble spore protein D (minor alpha/beta-type SASP)
VNYNMAQGGGSSNRILVPQARAAMDQFKMEAAREVGVTLQNGYNGDLTTRQAGSIGGQMVKKMIQSYEQQLSGQGPMA